MFEGCFGHEGSWLLLLMLVSELTVTWTLCFSAGNPLMLSEALTVYLCTSGGCLASSSLLFALMIRNSIIIRSFFSIRWVLSIISPVWSSNHLMTAPFASWNCCRNSSLICSIVVLSLSINKRVGRTCGASFMLKLALTTLGRCFFSSPLSRDDFWADFGALIS